MEMCRACLATGMGMVPMDEHFINKYNNFTNLNLTMADMPLYTCNICYEDVKFCIKFQEKCIASDLTLKELLPPNKIDPDLEVKEESEEEKYVIKEEIKVEQSDDDAEFLDDCYEYGEEYVEPTPKPVPMPERNRLCKNKKKDIVPIDVKLNCGLCPKILRNKTELNNHLEQHKTDFDCHICKESILNVCHMFGHRMNHIPKNQRVCHICSKKFYSSENLEFHCMRVHEMADKDAKIQCKVCLSTFDKVRKLQKHMQGHRKPKYKCDRCDKRFRFPNALKVHISSKHLNKHTFQCDLCEYTSTYHTGIVNHKLRKHTVDKAVCKTCGRIFANQQLLDKHKCKHGQPVVCPVCGITFQPRGKYTLNQHMKLHEAAQFKCAECGASFRSRGCYITHLDRHKGAPRFRCNYCERPFYSQSVLIKHRRVHTGEKPYICTICKKGFTGNHNLKVHMKVHGIVNLIKKKDNGDEENKQ